jgi:hypothetical protein
MLSESFSSILIDEKLNSTVDFSTKTLLTFKENESNRACCNPDLRNPELHH